MAQPPRGLPRGISLGEDSGAISGSFYREWEGKKLLNITNTYLLRVS